MVKVYTKLYLAILLWLSYGLQQSLTDAQPQVDSFTLVDTTSNTDVRILSDGTSFNVASIVPGMTNPELSIRADVSTAAITSVTFDFDGISNYRTEGVAPYTLGGDRRGDYDPVPELSTPGTYTVTATPNPNGVSNSITFTIVSDDDAPSSTSAPTTVPEATDVLPYLHSASGAVTGELKVWHKVTLGFDGPETSETDSSINPFSDFRLDVSFTHDSDPSVVYTVPGFYAADGNAANSGANSGNVWLVHFAPPLTGKWNWAATFVTGKDVAVDGGGTSAGFFDGASGSFSVGAGDKSGRDLRAHGLLEYVGEHHLQFAFSKEWFWKAGADAPENFLAYDDFDNTPNNGNRRKSWSPHMRDYKDGDPTWSGGKGKAIIGAVNYLSAQGMNAFSFLTMNIDGDDKNVFPFVSDNGGGDRRRFDVSKLAQWEVVFEHADHMGMFLHFKTQETENDSLLDEGGEFGLPRKLYYRELVARFGHHLALNWNIGEENTNSDTQRKAFADYLKQLDPYNHPVVVHTYPGQKNKVYTPLLGYPSYDGASLQSPPGNVPGDTLAWVVKSSNAGKKWVVANDEQGSANNGVVPDSVDPTHNIIRTNVLWGNLMHGGAGVEYYFGYAHPHSDLTCQDFRSRANMWRQSKHALDFLYLNNVPFWSMSNNNARSSSSNHWVLVDRNGEEDTIVVYVKDGSPPIIDFVGGGRIYSVHWYDPRNGGSMQTSAVQMVESGTGVSLGTPPGTETSGDWVVLLRAVGSADTNAPTVAPTDPSTASPSVVTTTASPTISVATASPTGSQVSVAPTPSDSPIVFVLIDAASNTVVRNLSDGDSYNVVSIVPGTLNPQLSLRADVLGSPSSVTFDFNGISNYQSERFAPYALRGDNNGDYEPVPELSTRGTYTITATTNPDGASTTIAFTVLDETDTIMTPPVTPSPTLPPTITPTASPTTIPPTLSTTAVPTSGLTASPTETEMVGVIGFTLVDSDTDQDLRILTMPNDSISLSMEKSKLNIRADTIGSTIASVTFVVNEEWYREESFAPYAVGGDANGDYNAMPELAVPDNILTIEAIPSLVGGGDGESAAIQITIIQ